MNQDKPTPSGYPDPLGTPPAEDRFCDLVLTGGVASGVVYPWTILELAREYRFKSLGGNSVGAMAAALAAAAEYGRCTGHATAFEALRLMPEKLAELDGTGRTKMQRLFQPSPHSRRLFEMFLVGLKTAKRLREVRTDDQGRSKRGCFKQGAIWAQAIMRGLLCLGPLPWLIWALCMVCVLAAFRPWQLSLDGFQGAALVVAGWSVALVLALLVFGAAVSVELRRGLAKNDWGLCRGKAVPPGSGATEPALVDWLHEAIQRSAGREPGDPPLTFADLWRAPRFGRPMAPPVADGYAPQPPDTGIALHMFSTNLSHGRPVRWPLYDPNSRLFFDEKEWRKIFPAAVLNPLLAASKRYAPGSKSDPEDAAGRVLYEIPCGDLPIVVAARLSLSFPLLFSCVPVWAVDYEKPPGERVLRRALLTDGGVCTNFPVHLFDAAQPRWPTFALLLDRRLKAYKGKGKQEEEGDALYLPKGHLEGRADNWQERVPADDDRLRGLIGLIGGLISTAIDWNDRSAMRLPHVRNRVIRYALRGGEGQLHIDMERDTILKMAHEYGRQAASSLIQSFDNRPDGNGQTQPFWRQHLYVRAMSEFRALQQHLRSYSSAVHAQRHSTPLHQLLREAQLESPLRDREGTLRKAAGEVLDKPLTREQAETLIALSEQIEALANALERASPAIGAYEGKPMAELRLRVPI